MTGAFISLILSVGGIIQAFYKIDKDNLTDYVSKVKRHRNKTVAIFVAAILVAIGSDFYDYHQGTLKDAANKESQRTIVNLRDSVATLRKENADAHKQIEDTVRACSKAGIETTELAEKHITKAVAEGIKIGVAEARANKDDIKRTIRDSIDKALPDLYLVNDKDPFFKENKDTSKYSLFFGVRNTGMNRAVKVRILYTPIFVLKPEYRKDNGKYFPTLEQSISGSDMEVSGNNNGKGGSITIAQFNEVLYENIYFRVRVFWESPSGKKDSFTQIWQYHFSDGGFTEIGYMEVELKNVISKLP